MTKTLREREMFVRCNILARKLLKCSFAVKANLFFCPSVYVFMTLLFGVYSLQGWIYAQNISLVIINVPSYFLVTNDMIV